MKKLCIVLALCSSVGTMMAKTWIDRIENNSGGFVIVSPNLVNTEANSNAILYSNADPGQNGTDNAAPMYNLPFFVAPGHALNLEGFVIPYQNAGNITFTIYGTTPTSETVGGGAGTTTVTCSNQMQALNTATIYDNGNGITISNKINASAVPPECTGTQALICNVGNYPGKFSSTMVVNSDGSVVPKSGPNWGGAGWPATQTWP